MHNKGISYGTLAFGVLALSTSAIFVKLAAAPSSVTAFYRLLIALLVLAPPVLFDGARRRELVTMPRRKLAMSLLAGVLLAVHYILWFESLRYTSVASSTVIVTLQPVFSMLFGYCFLKERQTALGVLGCAVALFGSFVIGFGDFQSGPAALFGDLLALVAAAIISAYFLMGQVIRRDTSATVYTVLAYGGSVIFLGLYTLVMGDPFTGYPMATWGCFLGLGLVSTILGQFIFNLLLKWLPATTISMSILGEPVGTCILAVLLLGETIGLQQGVGMAIILGGLGLYFWSLLRRKVVL